MKNLASSAITKEAWNKFHSSEVYFQVLISRYKRETERPLQLYLYKSFKNYASLFSWTSTRPNDSCEPVEQIKMQEYSW